MQIPPEQTGFVITMVVLIVTCFIAMLVLKVAVWMAEKRAGVEYRWEAPEVSEPGPFRKWIESHAAAQEARYTPRRYVVMSWPDDPKEETVSDPVYIPVSNTSMVKTDIPDIEAEKPFDRDITDGEWIVRMACARGDDKKYRFSANAIYAAVGGDRNTVLAKIREIRNTPPPAEYTQPDGTKVPASYPVTGRTA